MKSRRFHRDMLLPLAVLGCLSALALLGWRKDSQLTDRRIRDTDRILATVVAENVSDFLMDRTRDMTPLEVARLTGHLDTPNEFNQTAAALQRAHPEYAFLVWVGPGGNIIWSRGGRGEALRGFDLNTLPGRAALLQRAAEQRGPAVSPPFQVLNGQRGLVLVSPIVRIDRVDGFVVAGIAGDGLVRECVPAAYRGDYNVMVAEPGGQALSYASTPGPYAMDALARAVGRSYRVSVWPTPVTLATLRGSLGGRSLATDLAFAFLICIVVGVAVSQRRRAMERAEERREALEALKVSERRLSDIVALSPWVVIEHGPDGKIVNANHAAELVYKTTRDQMIGHDPREWICPDDRDLAMQHIAAHASGRETSALVNRNVDSEGRTHQMRWTGIQRHDAKGNPIGAISFGLDITAEVEANNARDRLLAEEQSLIERLWSLNDFARSLRTTLDTASLYNIAIRAASNVLANRACVLMRYDRESDALEVVALRASLPESLPSFPFAPGHHVAAAETDLINAVRESGQVIADDLTASSTLHEQAAVAAGYLSRAAVPILVDNVCVGLLVSYGPEKGGHTRDSVEFMQGVAEHLALALTSSRLFGDLKRAYQQLQDVQDQMVQMEKLRAVGEMASGIAHDFNNSLASVLGYAELLAEEELTGDRHLYVQNILKAAHDAATTVRRIQEYSRRLPREQDYQLLDLNAMASEAVALTRHKWRDQAQSKGITVRVDLLQAPNLPEIRGDPSEIREILTNFVFNAVDAMPRGGAIRMRTGRRGRQVYISVEDSGTGMSDEVRTRIFEPFFTTKGREGNGLGLAVSHAIARRHGGDIEVESTLGAGSTLRLVMPIAPKHAADKTRTVGDGQMKPVTALVIDDDPSVAEVVSALLQRLGNTVETAGSGEEGLDLLRHRSYDVVFTDLGMPGMSGREVALSAKRVSPGTPVVLLTGWGDQFRSGQEVPDGVDLVLGKPVKLDHLREALGRVSHRNGDKSN